MSAVSPIFLSITSAAFRPFDQIPKRYTCDGEDVSPPLSWSGVPEGTAAFALTLDDPETPSGVLTHWVYYNLPGTLRELPEGVEKIERPGTGGMQGRNDFGKIGYTGPCPPPGPARQYHLILYALDELVDLPHGSTKPELVVAMVNHVLRHAELKGVYQRNGSSRRAGLKMRLPSATGWKASSRRA